MWRIEWTQRSKPGDSLLMQMGKLAEFLEQRLGTGCRIAISTTDIWTPKPWVQDLFGLAPVYSRMCVTVTRYGIFRVNVEFKAYRGDRIRVWSGYPWETGIGFVLLLLFPLRWLLALFTRPLARRVVQALTIEETTAAEVDSQISLPPL